ncbi:MAG: SMP-30/gluconolactonase/LRE family protein [Bryobacterales bacterium]|nr:SMP-30/gluconolactonase/LRE family protein [Bryobacterales bacterium]
MRPVLVFFLSAFAVLAAEGSAVAVLHADAALQGVATSSQASPFVAYANGGITQILRRNVADPLANTGGNPAGMAFGIDGNLYVADRGRKAILKVTPWGEISVFTDRCGGKPFSTPAHIAASSDGAFYFTDTQDSRVYRVDTGGRTTEFSRDVPQPTGIAAAAEGGPILVAGRGGKVWKLPSNGKRLTLFATLAGEGEPSGMALDEKGNLYIARDGGGVVTVLGPNGGMVTSYAIPDRRPADLAFGGLPDMRSLYICGVESQTLYKLTAPFRSQGMPWEADPPFAITEPVDGAILNRHDGEATAEGLKIAVRGYSRVGSVRVNSIRVPAPGGKFETSLVLQERQTKIILEGPRGARRQITVLWDRYSYPRYRVSTDDNILWLKDIARHAGTYHSIIDNAYLAFWREMHRKYGAKVHFNIYYETAGFNLSEMPDKYKPEWKANADWIRLSFHARANDPAQPYQHAPAERIGRDNRLVNQEIERFAGREVMSDVTTVHYGATTLAGARALRAQGIKTMAGYFRAQGALAGDGPLAGDSPLVSYYLPLAQWRYMTGRDYWKDMKEDIIFVRHDMVINSVPLGEIEPQLERIGGDPHQAEIIELMIHEQYFYPDYVAYEPDYRQRVETAIAWVTRRGYKPVFYDEGFAGAAAR